jgi:secreted trypsin-like serine protease
MRHATATASWRLTVWAAALASALAGLFGGAARAGDAPLIIGGEKAAPGEFPWQVALLNAEIGNTFTAQYCGGALIAAQWVVTAAHCVVDGRSIMDPDEVDVLVGTTSLASGGTRVGVERVVVHGRYNARTDENDIALLRLAEPVGLEALPVLTRADEARLSAAGTLATATGWGNTSIRGEDFPVDLRKVRLPIVTNRVCNGPRSYDGDVTVKMLCAGLAAGGKDTCQGDSGGPLVVPDGEGGVVLAGITSWGAACAAPNKYGVYTRVARFATWIEKMIGERRRAAPAPLSTASRAAAP